MKYGSNQLACILFLVERLSGLYEQLVVKERVKRIRKHLLPVLSTGFVTRLLIPHTTTARHTLFTAQMF